MNPLPFILILFISMFPAKAQVVHQIYFDRFSHYKIDDWITYAPALEVTSIDVGEEYIYFGTRKGGILRYHVYDNFWDYPFTMSSGLRSNHIHYIVYSFTENQLYAQTSQGVDVYNKAFDFWQATTLESLPNRRQPSQSDLDDYYQRRNYNYPNYYRPGNSELPDFFTDSKYIFRPPDEIMDEHNRIFRIANERVVDNWRNLWLATRGLGPAKSNLNYLNLEFFPKSISNIEPHDLVFDGDNAWIVGLSLGSEPDGINRWNLLNNEWQYYEARYNFGIYADDCHTVAANNEYVFFGSEQGLIIYDKTTGRWNTLTISNGLESNKINHLFLKNNTLFIATDEGFNWLSPDDKNIQESEDTSLDNVPIYRITGSDSTIYFATRNGLYEYFPPTDMVRFLASSSAVLDLYISALNIDQDTLWLAGNYGIMFRNPANGKWSSFTQIREYISGMIYDIAFTEKTVWFGTDNGLLKYDKNRDYWYLYTEKDGLADRHVFSIIPDHHDLWLCTKGGLTIFRWNRKGRLE